MAGIGVELKKIYSKNNLSNLAMGTAYSSMVTVGPTVLIVAILILMYGVLGFNYVNIADRELLSSVILYVFVFCGIIISPFNAVFSRYIADKIYQDKTEDILPSYYTGICTVCLVGTLIAVPLMLRLVFVSYVDVPFVIASYVFWIALIIVFFSLIYIHATKDYKTITLFYALGMCIAFLLSYMLQEYVSVVHSLLYGLSAGFFTIAFLEFAHVRRWFKSDGTNYSECLKYLWRYKKLFFANGLYTVGVYSHVFIFWSAEGSILIAKTFYSHPMYDMATCLAMFSNISTTIIFIVMAETQFHDEYQQYMQSVIGGTYRTIRKNKNILFRTLAQQVIRLVAIQSMITAVIFLLVVTFLPRLFFSSMIMEIYPVLSIGYFLLFLMYSLVIYLYYFNDQTGCVVLSSIFLVATTIGTFYSKELDIQYYGMGFVFGAFCGFTYAYFRLKSIEKTINNHIFCKGTVVKPVKKGKVDNVAYNRDEEAKKAKLKELEEAKLSKKKSKNKKVKQKEELKPEDKIIKDEKTAKDEKVAKDENVVKENKNAQNELKQEKLRAKQEDKKKKLLLKKQKQEEKVLLETQKIEEKLLAKAQKEDDKRQAKANKGRTLLEIKSNENTLTDKDEKVAVKEKATEEIREVKEKATEEKIVKEKTVAVKEKTVAVKEKTVAVKEIELYEDDYIEEEREHVNLKKRSKKGKGKTSKKNSSKKSSRSSKQKGKRRAKKKAKRK